MSFAGHVLDMIQRMRQNREMTNKRESLKDIQSHSKGHYKHRPTPQPKLTTQKRKRIADAIRKQERKVLAKQTAILLFILGAIASAIYYMY